MSYRVNDNEFVFGNNDIGSKLSFKERMRYQDLFPDDYDFPDAFSFWDKDNTYYGREDTNMDVVFPNETFLTQVPNAKPGVFALNFVVDAYNDFLQYMKVEGFRKLVGDPIYSGNWKASKGWQDVHDQHYRGIVSSYESFGDVFLSQQANAAKILNYGSFLDSFMNDYLVYVLPEVPFTKTGFIRSKYSTPLLSGLCLELGGFNHADDFSKYDLFVNNINFKTYLLAANKYGFMVDRNAPWRLIANLESPQMKPYINKYMLKYKLASLTTIQGTSPSTMHQHEYSLSPQGNGFTDYYVDPELGENLSHRHEIVNYKIIKSETVTHELGVSVGLGPHTHFVATEPQESFTIDDVYRTFFVRSDQYDVESFKVFMMQFYNTYATAFPTVSIPKLVLCKPSSPAGAFSISQQTKVVKVFRKLIGKKLHDEVYSELFWMKTYFLVRLKELGQDVETPKLNKVIQKISQIYILVDKQRAFDYINTYLKQFY
tara:strand:+ start:1553 stop:3010 length:1458 start_codon:yes stop_codon:yes gene_type:complete